MNPYELLWQKILKELEKIYSSEVYEELFAPITSINQVKNDHIFLLVENIFTKNRINRLYLNKINELAEKISPTPIRFKVICKDDDDAETDKKIIDKKLHFNYKAGNLNANYTFNNFIVGKSNNFAFRSAMIVADQPGESFNPFYIFGDVGLGKTHLMHAIGNYILDQDVTKKVLYVQADGFINDYTSLLKTSKIDEFNKKYQNIDVFLVDDIQIMSKAKATQQEFFKLFNHLVDNNKQIVITSDRPASELKDFMDRLTSRFQQGLLADITVPDLEHRVAILKKKLPTFDPNSHVSDEILSFIAESFITNVRELEGALKKLLTYSDIYGTEIDLQTAYDALESLLKTKKTTDGLSENNYDKVQSLVADFYSLSVDDLISKKRSSNITTPRHVAMYIIKTKFNLPYKVIGQIFGNRDHSTVLVACEKVENEMKSNKALNDAINILLRKLSLSTS